MDDLPEMLLASAPASDEIEYNVQGYDMALRDRYVYAFLCRDGHRVKVGLVNSRARLAPRLREVARACGQPDLHEVAHVEVCNIDGHEVEDVEGAIRLWLTRAQGFRHAGMVDWLEVPAGNHDWSKLLSDALSAVDEWNASPRAGV